jgi:hypothetical protein
MRLSDKICENEELGVGEQQHGLLCQAMAYEFLLLEARALFRTYEESHRKRGPEHLEKAERNADIAKRIEECLGIPASFGMGEVLLPDHKATDAIPIPPVALEGGYLCQPKAETHGRRSLNTHTDPPEV